MSAERADRSWGFKVSGYGHDEEDAWRLFASSLDSWLYWLKGRKYWRAAPQYTLDTRRGWGGESEHYVIARIVVVSWDIPNLIEVKMGPPWPSVEEVREAVGSIPYVPEPDHD